MEKNLDVTKYKAYIISIANKYNVTDDVKKELLQEGYIGVFEASKVYDEKHGISFISFATYYIKKYMIQYLNNNLRTVRIPINKLHKLKEYQKIEDPYTADLSNFSKKDLEFIHSNNHKPVLSLDDYETTVGDMIQQIDNLPEYDQNEIKKMLLALEYVKPAYRELIIMHYGLFDTEPMTLEEMSKHTNTTKSNVASKLKKAIKMLKEAIEGRTPEQINKQFIQDYLNNKIERTGSVETKFSRLINKNKNK